MRSKILKKEVIRAMVKNKYVCEKCKKEFTRKSNLDLHYLTCDGTGKNIKNKTIIDKSSINNTKCDHDMIMLNPKIMSNKRAIMCGYSAVCRKCGELA
jgi:uncharacterized Zn-finger protein